MSIQIQNIEGLTMADLHDELIAGGRFITYQYCVSFLFITFRPTSDIYFIRSGENAFLKGLHYSIISFILGWWGFPWGPLHTVNSITSNFKGGNDITEAVFNELMFHHSVIQPVVAR